MVAVVAVVATVLTLGLAIFEGLDGATGLVSGEVTTGPTLGACKTVVCAEQQRGIKAWGRP